MFSCFRDVMFLRNFFRFELEHKISTLKLTFALVALLWFINCCAAVYYRYDDYETCSLAHNEAVVTLRRHPGSVSVSSGVSIDGIKCELVDYLKKGQRDGIFPLIVAGRETYHSGNVVAVRDYPQLVYALESKKGCRVSVHGMPRNNCGTITHYLDEKYGIEYKRHESGNPSRPFYWTIEYLL